MKRRTFLGTVAAIASTFWHRQKVEAQEAQEPDVPANHPELLPHNPNDLPIVKFNSNGQITNIHELFEGPTSGKPNSTLVWLEIDDAMEHHGHLHWGEMKCSWHEGYHGGCKITESVYSHMISFYHIGWRYADRL